MFKYIIVMSILPLACFGAAIISPPTSKASPPRIVWYDVLDSPEFGVGGWSNTVVIRAWSNGKIEARGVSWDAYSNCNDSVYMCDDWRIIND